MDALPVNAPRGVRGRARPGVARCGVLGGDDMGICQRGGVPLSQLARTGAGGHGQGRDEPFMI